ncbi:MAG: phosphoribosylglycinamide formyltransferase [Planctomycetes bacterium]|nr:phosphoribosylglycinamide formyltransferase [Planctomycetota bacterium]
MKPLRIAVLLSGSGTTMQNLIDLSRAGKLPVEIVLAVSDRPNIKGLERAELAGIPAEVVKRDQCASLQEFSQRIFGWCRQFKADLVVMGGFLRLIQIPEDFQNKVMNIHPSLIPSFCGKGYHGLKVHEAVINYGNKVTGCTIHFADNQYDTGPIILQKTVPVLDDDTPEILMRRVFEEECKAYPEAIQLFAQGKLQVNGRRVRILK